MAYIKSLRVEGHDYPLFDNLADVTDDTGHYMTVYDEDDGKTYYGRVIAMDSKGNVTKTASQLGNTHFPNTNKSITLSYNGGLMFDDYMMSDSAISSKGADCDCTNCQTNKQSGSNESGTHVVQRNGECTYNLNNNTYGGVKQWVNRNNCTTAWNGHDYGNASWSDCNRSNCNCTYGGVHHHNDEHCNYVETECGTPFRIYNDSYCSIYGGGPQCKYLDVCNCRCDSYYDCKLVYKGVEQAWFCTGPGVKFVCTDCDCRNNCNCDCDCDCDDCACQCDIDCIPDCVCTANFDCNCNQYAACDYYWNNCYLYYADCDYWWNNCNRWWQYTGNNNECNY